MRDIKLFIEFLKMTNKNGVYELRQPIYNSFYAASLNELEKILKERATKKKDFYIGIFERRKVLNKASNRENIKGTYFYVLDLDLKDKNWQEKEEKRKLVKNIIEALKDKLALVVDSGRGVHFYIKFKDYVWEDNWNEKAWEKYVKNLAKNLNIQILNKENGWGLDPAVKDLVRVIRVPGSFNTKAERFSKIIYYNFENVKGLDYENEVLKPYEEEERKKEIEFLRKKVKREVKKEVKRDVVYKNIVFKEDLDKIFEILEENISFIDFLKNKGYEYKEYADRVHFYSPFRDDGRNPDFVIYKNNEFWGIDFGSGEWYNPYKYLVEEEGLSPKEAIIELIKEAGLEDELLKEVEIKEKKKRKKKEKKIKTYKELEKEKEENKEGEFQIDLPILPWDVIWGHKLKEIREFVQDVRNTREEERLEKLFAYAQKRYSELENYKSDEEKLFFLLNKIANEIRLTILTEPYAVFKVDKDFSITSFMFNLFVPVFILKDEKGKRRFLIYEIREEKDLKRVVDILKRKISLDELINIANKEEINLFLYEEGKRINENTFPLTSVVERGTEKKINEFLNLTYSFLKYYNLLKEEKVAYRLGNVRFKDKSYFIHPHKKSDVFINVDEHILDDHTNENVKDFYTKEYAQKYAKIFDYIKEEGNLLMSYLFGISALIHNNYSKDNFIVQFYGTTGTGKTTTLRLIKSLVANPENIPSLNATLNAIEKSLEQETEIHIRDEFELADRDTLLKLIYTFTQGIGRQRLTKTLAFQKQSKFRGGLFLAGEKTIDKVVEEKASSGEIRKRGALRRVIKIEVDEDFIKDKNIISELRDIIYTYFGFGNYIIDVYKDIEERYKNKLKAIHKVLKTVFLKSNLDRHSDVMATNLISLKVLKEALKRLGKSVNEEEIKKALFSLIKQVKLDLGQARNEKISLYKDLFEFALNNEEAEIQFENYSLCPQKANIKLFKIDKAYLEKIKQERNVVNQVGLAITEEKLQEFCKKYGYDIKIVISILKKDKRLFIKENGEKYLVNFREKEKDTLYLKKKKAYIIALPYEIENNNNDIDFKFLLKENEYEFDDNFYIKFFIENYEYLFEIDDIEDIVNNNPNLIALRIVFARILKLKKQKETKKPPLDEEKLNAILEEIYNNHNLFEILTYMYDKNKCYGDVLIEVLPYLEDEDLKELEKRL